MASRPGNQVALHCFLFNSTLVSEPGCLRFPPMTTVLTSALNCSKDARLPVQLQRAMAAEAEAAREARAKVRLSSRTTQQQNEKTISFENWKFRLSLTPAFISLPFFQVIAAEGEQKASRALKEASEVIAESSSALQLRYLQACPHYMIGLRGAATRDIKPILPFFCRPSTRSRRRRTRPSSSRCPSTSSRTS